ncbi:MAG: glycosyl hydrolase family 28-related protein, partial [bacterium]
GVEQVGNEGENLRFFGGDYGITTTKPSPSWPYVLMDAWFEGQRKACIQTEEGGLTLTRNHFKASPTAISINPDRAEELFIEDSSMEDISGPAIVINDLKSARTEVNALGVACTNVPVFAKFREGGKEVAGKAGTYKVSRFTHGLHLPDLGDKGEVKTTFETAGSVQTPRPLPDIPTTDQWFNVRSLGAVGDGTTDDTRAFQEAIEKHRVVYVPSGRYVITDTLTLKHDTVLIGLNPITTQLAILDETPAYQGIGNPKPLLETPPGGTNIVMGIALDTGGINPRAVAAKWQAGEASYMNDVKFYGGHGSVPWVNLG